MSEVSFTCNTCGLSFQQADFQREHMKTDWHRYNLKRRVADLPPVPSDIFAEKMIQQRSAQLDARTKENPRRQVTKKDLKRMDKQQRRERSANGAVSSDAGTPGSRSRASSVTSGVSGISGISLGKPATGSVYQSDAEDDAMSEDDEGEPAEAGARDSDIEEALIQEKLQNMVKIPSNVSFMDGYESESVEANVEYLERKFGLVLPERKYLVDLEGLVGYLNEKIGLGNVCLSCSYMGRSLEAVRAHMLAKQHVKIPYQTLEERLELADFYDFSSSYAKKSNGAGAADGEWENVSDDGEEADDTVVLDDGDEEEILDNDVHVDGFELKLAPGVTAGHRSLQRYFKQRLTTALDEKPGRQAIKMIDARGPGVSEKQATKMIKAQWKAQKRQKYEYMKHDKHINFQKHFRDEMLQ